jgi:hypothetical protein
LHIFVTSPVVTGDPQPPGSVHFDLEEALDLLASLEDARDVLHETDHLAVLAQVEHEIVRLNHKLGFHEM